MQAWLTPRASSQAWQGDRSRDPLSSSYLLAFQKGLAGEGGYQMIQLHATSLLSLARGAKGQSPSHRASPWGSPKKHNPH